MLSEQAAGEQQRALAGSIAAFAGMLVERPDARPDSLLSRIAHKHASLGVTADQYKIVHRHPFAAIAEVLGDAVRSPSSSGPPTACPRGRSAGASTSASSPDCPTARLPDCPTARRLPADPPVQPVRRAGPDRPAHHRQARAGRRGSRTWLHAHGREGDVLTVSAPFGDLVLTEDDGPLLPASAGIGVTPVLAMLNHLAASGATRPVTVVHADRGPASHAHACRPRRSAAPRCARGGHPLRGLRARPLARSAVAGERSRPASAGHAPTAGIPYRR